MDFIISNIGLTFMYSTPIIIAAIGGLYAERSGVTNIGLEGIMLIGAFTSATACYYLGVNISSASFYTENILPWLCVLVGAITGGIYSLLHAIASIKFKADQTISGTAINFLATGLTLFLCEVIFQQQRTPNYSYGFIKMKIPIISEIPIIGDILNETYSPFIFSIFFVILTSFIINKTRFGLRLRACGEYPQAAASMGVNVYKMRYIGVILSGVLAGAAGAIMVLTVDQQFSVSVIHGFGFIAIATLIFGQWRSLGVLLAGLFFGLSNVLATATQAVDAFKKMPQELFFMLPYVLTILALILTSKKTRAPKAVGEIYDESKR